MILLAILLGLILAYFFYTRFIKVYSTLWYYRDQGVLFKATVIPFIGNLLELANFKGAKNHPLFDWNRETYARSDGSLPPFSGVVFNDRVCLLVNRPEPCEDLFITKNKYFDKHFST